MRHKKLIPAIIYFVLIVMLLPAIWYSLRTSFSLIDDYNTWIVTNEFASLPAVSDWFRNLFFNYGPGRVRSFWTIYQAMTWTVLGLNPILHHLVRLLIKFAVVYVSLKIFSYFTKDKLRALNAGVLAFLSIYLFFPNNPEARLTQLEIEGVFFLSATIFFLCEMLMQEDGNICHLSRVSYSGLLLSFMFLGFTKEPFFVLVFTCLCFIVILNLRVRAFFRIVPFVVISVFHYYKVLGTFRGGGYGIAPLSADAAVGNVLWYSKSLLLIDTSVIFSVMFAIPVLYYLCRMTIDIRKRLRTNPVILEQCPCPLMHFRDRLTGMLLYDKEFTFYLFLLLNFLAFYAITLTFWLPVLRYFYPLVYLLALLIGVSIVQSLQLWKHSKKFALVVIIASLYFVSVNYYNFLYQFACQYAARNTERRMLMEITSLLEQNQKVCIVVDSEYEDKVVIYFNQYLPKYHRTDYRIASVQKHDIFTLFNGDVYYVTKDAVFHSDDTTIPGHMVLEKKFIDDQNLPLLKVANKISSAALLGKSPPFFWCDAGARPIGSQSWYIYKINFNLENERNRAHILYESNQLCEILGAKPYGEHRIELPKTLTKDHIFIVTLKYHTVGNAIPYVILIQTPYRSDNLPLHHEIQPSAASGTMELLFSPGVDTPLPQILLRNWSIKGSFVVESIKVLEIGIDTNDINSK
jgi:hypothetical protein